MQNSQSSGVVDHSAARSGPTDNLQRQQLTSDVSDEARGTSANEMPTRQPQSVNQMATPMQPATGLKLPFPTIKLGTYSGTGSLETFLAKFNNTASYIGWTERDRLYHLCSCLEGAAGQVLWDAGPQRSTQEVIRLLQTRFGHELQAERFKAELRARRRKAGETLQQLYQDICRLVALAYPGSEQSLVQHVTKEAFLTALNDAGLQLKVMEREPKSIEEALNIASKLEAYEKSLSTQNRQESSDDDERGHRKPRKIYAVTKETSALDVTTLTEQIVELQRSMASVLQKMDAMCSDITRNRKMSSGAAAGTDKRQPSGSITTRRPPALQRRKQDKAVNPCRTCGTIGHWAECDKRNRTGIRPIVMG